MPITKKITAPVPIGLARSALFSVASCGSLLEEFDPFHFTNKTVSIHHLRKPELTYTGPALNQYHALLWQALWHFASNQPRESNEQESEAQGAVATSEPRRNYLTVSSDDLLRAMGRKPRDQRQRQRVWQGLKTLQRAFIEYKTPTHEYSGALIGDVIRDRSKTSRRYQLFVIELKPALRNLLSNEVLHNDLSRKASLHNNHLAMWLHDFIASWGRYAVIDEPVELIHKLSRSPLALPQFRQRLKAALEVLKNQENALLISGEIDPHSDRLHIEKVRTNVTIFGPKATDEAKPTPPWKDKLEKAKQAARNQRAGPTM